MIIFKKYHERKLFLGFWLRDQNYSLYFYLNIPHTFSLIKSSVIKSHIKMNIIIFKGAKCKKFDIPFFVSKLFSAKREAKIFWMWHHWKWQHQESYFKFLGDLYNSKIARICSAICDPWSEIRNIGNRHILLLLNHEGWVFFGFVLQTLFWSGIRNIEDRK